MSSTKTLNSDQLETILSDALHERNEILHKSPSKFSKKFQDEIDSLREKKSENLNEIMISLAVISQKYRLKRGFDDGFFV